MLKMILLVPAASEVTLRLLKAIFETEGFVLRL